jgi:DNA polymerase III delta prime subunit
MNKTAGFDGINKILNREHTSNQIKEILTSFDAMHKSVLFKKGIYIYGSPGSGKTEFVTRLLNELNYDIIKYDAGDLRNKSLIETITNNNISNRNVLDMMSKKVKKIAIVMDEIDGMNNGDKGGITALIKLIRQKKTKKQRLENKTSNPIICIGNYYVDKKIKELMKVCTVFEIKAPTDQQISHLFAPLVASAVNSSHKDILLKYIQGDMRKLKFVNEMFSKKPELITDNIIENIFHKKSYNEDSKKITQSLINNRVSIERHNQCINETDRTIVALLWHENVVDVIQYKPNDDSFPFYSEILENMCFADYIDRITFQHQIWQFNEMSSLIKTFYNNKKYHDKFPENKNRFQPSEVRFTKVLTKYSTEYNNIVFIFNLCQQMGLDKKDLVSLFQELRIFNGQKFGDSYAEIENTFENYDITKLDVRRMYRYLDKNVKKETVDDDLLEEELEL